MVGGAKGLRDMKNSNNQFVEAGWTFINGVETYAVMVLAYSEGPRKDYVAKEGDIVTSGSGETWTLTGARAPHKPSSTGRIHVTPIGGEDPKRQREFFPSVCGLGWRAVQQVKESPLLGKGWAV